MEKRTRFTKKLVNLFWGFIGALPIIIFLITILNLQLNRNTLFDFANMDASLQLTYNSFLTTLREYTQNTITFVNTQFSFLTNNGLYSTLSRLFKTLFNLDLVYTYSTLSFVIVCLTWYVYTQLIHIVVDFILLLPNICKRFFRKVGGDYE